MTTVARLRALVTVADAGSVREAARRLTVTESAVSAALSALAREVRVPLVERDGRGLRLTAPGQAYCGYARAILGLHEEGLAAALASFISRHPAVDLRLEVGSSARLRGLFAAHEADLVIGGRPPGHVGDAVIRAVRPNLLVVVAAPQVAADFDIGRTRWLQREAGSGTRATGEALLSGLDADPPRLTLGSGGAALACAAAGLGATLTSRDAVRRQLNDGELVEVAVVGTPLRRPWNAVTHGRQPGATALLVRHLLDREGWHVPRERKNPARRDAAP